MDRAGIKKKITEYYHTNEAYFDKLEGVFTERGQGALRIGAFDIMGYVTDAERILDLGCGSGALITFIKKSFPLKVCCGIDLSPIAVNKAAEKSRKQGLDIRFIVADIEKDAPYFNDGFDLIIAHEVFEHLVNPDKAVMNAAKLLKKNGILVIIAPNRLVRAPLKTIAAKFVDYIKMALDKKYLNITNIDPPLDTLGGDSDAVYVTNPWEMHRMVRMAGLEILKKSNIRCRLAARKT